MDIEQARISFDAGMLKEAIIEPADEGNGWMILLREQDDHLAKLTDHSGTEKIYHTIDHATEVAKQIGFDTIRVEEPF